MRRTESCSCADSKSRGRQTRGQMEWQTDLWLYQGVGCQLDFTTCSVYPCQNLDDFFCLFLLESTPKIVLCPSCWHHYLWIRWSVSRLFRQHLFYPLTCLGSIRWAHGPSSMASHSYLAWPHLTTVKLDLNLVLRADFEFREIASCHQSLT